MINTFLLMKYLHYYFQINERLRHWKLKITWSFKKLFPDMLKSIEDLVCNLRITPGRAKSWQHSEIVRPFSLKVFLREWNFTFPGWIKNRPVWPQWFRITHLPCLAVSLWPLDLSNILSLSKQMGSQWSKICFCKTFLEGFDHSACTD